MDDRENRGWEEDGVKAGEEREEWGNSKEREAEEISMGKFKKKGAEAGNAKYGRRGLKLSPPPPPPPPP